MTTRRNFLVAGRRQIAIRDYVHAYDRSAALTIVRSAIEPTLADSLAQRSALTGLVAVDATSGTIVGVLIYRIDHSSVSPTKASRTNEILAFAVLRSMQNQKIGLHLMDVFRRMFDDHRSRLTLAVPTTGNKDAESLYRRAGYKTDSEDDNPFKDFVRNTKFRRNPGGRA